MTLTLGAPPIGAHRLVSSGTSAALVTPAGEVDWWCAPRLDGPPLLWSLLDRTGACARWEGAAAVRAGGPPAGPVVRTVLRVDGGLVEALDAVVAVEGGAALVRAVRSLEQRPLAVRHALSVGGFDTPPGAWDGRARTDVAGVPVVVVGAPSEAGEPGVLHSPVTAGPEWAGVAVLAGTGAGPSFADLVARAEEAEAAARRRLRRARLPRSHPERAADALAVVHACTYEPTGAVVASPTTSLPEAPGADRQFDYRYCWLRDAGLAVSVAALLGDRPAAARYLSFLNRVAAGGVPGSPVVAVDGGAVPREEVVGGVAGWAGSRPVRVGNAAAGQVQYDALGMVVEAVSVYLQTGGALDDDTWAMVRAVADAAAEEPEGPTSGIWELREPRRLVSADVGRWLALDRAVWIARGWRPLARRRRWKRARDAARARVLATLGPDGVLPQSYDDPDPRPDAAALMVPVFGMLDRRDERAGRLVDAVLERLGDGPFVRRYPPGDDGFAGTEGAFVPVSAWAVSALAVLGRVDEARRRLDAMAAVLPRLVAEEVDPATGASLGNVPLVWSHAELARALYVLDAAERRRRWGAAGLWAWRLGRYARLRWRRSA